MSVIKTEESAGKRVNYIDPKKWAADKYVASGDCWEWSGRLDKDGYGVCGKFVGSVKHQRAHRAFYHIFKGDIPDQLEVDHICRNRKCVNPEHLQAITGIENRRRSPHRNRRKTHCKRGHPLTGEHLHIEYDYLGRSSRRCRTCSAILQKQRRAKKRAAL